MTADHTSPTVAEQAAQVFADEVALLRDELDDYKSRVTRGGPPPKCDPNWANQQLPGGPDPEYRGI